MSKWKIGCYTLSLAGLFVLVGCGEKTPPGKASDGVTAKGKITVGGSTLPYDEMMPYQVQLVSPETQDMMSDLLQKDGTYSIPAVPPGTYILSIMDPSNPSPEGAKGVKVTIEESNVGGEQDLGTIDLKDAPTWEDEGQ